MNRTIVDGRPGLVVEDRDHVGDRGYRFRAYLKGRSCGGYLTGFGKTEDAAVADLERAYQRELDAVSAGRHGLADARKRR